MRWQDSRRQHITFGIAELHFRPGEYFAHVLNQVFTLRARGQGEQTEASGRDRRGGDVLIKLFYRLGSFSGGWFFRQRFKSKEQTKRSFCLQPRRLICPPGCYSLNCSRSGDFCFIRAAILEGVPFSVYSLGTGRSQGQAQEPQTRYWEEATTCQERDRKQPGHRFFVQAR